TLALLFSMPSLLRNFPTFCIKQTRMVLKKLTLLGQVFMELWITFPGRQNLEITLLLVKVNLNSNFQILVEFISQVEGDVMEVYLLV
ncbi:hypothetical protein EDY47_23655, partial [Salmonella enterica]|nr:hypothetical protein [Salmonella enterica]